MDELGPARREKLVSLSGLFVTLRLKDHIGDAYDPRPFEVDQFHDAIVDKIGGMFPRLQEVLDNDFDTEDSFLDAINKAVQAEKEAGE